MAKVIRTVLLALLCIFLVAASLASLSNPGQEKSPSPRSVQKKLNELDPNGVVVAANGPVTKVLTDINSQPLRDNPDLYQYDDPGSIETMYITIRQGSEDKDTNHTWREVNDATKFFFENMEHVIVPKTEAILQIGDENGPLPGELGYTAQIPNATIQIRGNSTSMAPQKSYKIELFDSAGEWRGQQTINLNKHIYDPTRIKNKLAYDLIQGIPGLVSLRTQFVHLYVKDETTDPPAQAFEDYGLFTQVEQPNKRFLKNHLLDRYGQLYKAVMFEFHRYPDQLRLADDPLYDEEEFSKVLEIKGNKDHAKLLAMLDDVNNWEIPIEQTFQKYFDEENYFTWMAFNILVESVDTNAQNFYLYSPQNGQKWYFIPWDYDAAFDRQGNTFNGIHPYERGVHTYWGTVLHERVLRVPEYREKLDQKIQELMGILTRERIQELLDIYRPVAETYINQMPDQYHYPLPSDEIELAFERIPGEPQANYAVYLESLETPMPFYLGVPEIHGNTMLFMWEEVYDFRGGEITYDFIVSRSADFQDVAHQTRLTNQTSIEIPRLEPGEYYWRVVATNQHGKSQVPFDYYTISDDEWGFGMKYLGITPDGQIIEKQ